MEDASIKSVDEYIKKLPSPQKELCQKLRQIIKKTLPKIQEKMFGGVPSYENRVYIIGLRDHVNLGLSLKGLTKEQINSLDSKGKLTGSIKYYAESEVDEKRIASLIKNTKPYA